jgi:molybdate transport system permease protein
MDTTALLLTLRLAATTTVLLLLIGLPLAYWIAFSHSKARFFVQAAVTLPLVLPPTVIGFYLLVALGPLTPVGRLLIRLIGHPLAFSFTGLVIGSVIYSLPFAVQPLVNGFSAVDRDSIETAAVLGASPLRIFTGVTLPLAKASLLTSIILAFTHTVGEFGVVLMLGGDIPGATRTLSISLYNQVQDFNYQQANHTALLLLLLSFTALLLIYLRPASADRRDLV